MCVTELGDGQFTNVLGMMEGYPKGEEACLKCSIPVGTAKCNLNLRRELWWYLPNSVMKYRNQRGWLGSHQQLQAKYKEFIQILA